MMRFWLTSERIAERIVILRKDLSDFSLAITEEERIRTQCGHVDQNGNFAVVPCADGHEYMCTICDSRFSMNALNYDDVKDAVKIIRGVLEVSKVAYDMLRDEVAQRFFEMIPALKRIPSLYLGVTAATANTPSGLYYVPLFEPGDPIWFNPKRIDTLRKSSSKFSLTITEEERIRAQCGHVDQNGNFAVVPCADGHEYMCTICDSRFSMDALNYEDVRDAVKVIRDVLEVTKVAYDMLRDEVAQCFFAIIPALKKIPSLYAIFIAENNYIDSLIMSRRPQFITAHSLDTDKSLVIRPWLTAEQITALRKSSSEFSLTITEEDRIRAQCNHFDQNGNFAGVRSVNGSGYICNICGSRFSMDNLDYAQVARAVDYVCNILEVIKVKYISCPGDAMREFFVMLPLLNKIPFLYSIAMTNSDKFGAANDFTNPQFMSQRPQFVPDLSLDTDIATAPIATAPCCPNREASSQSMNDSR